MRKNNLLRVSCLLLSTLLLGICSCNAYAGSGGDQGGGTNTGGKCTPNNGLNAWPTSLGSYCQYAGMGWVHYEYTTTNKVTIPFIATGGNAGSVINISSECVSYGGFYKFSFFARKNGSKTVGNTTVTWNGTGGGGTPRRSDFNALIDTNVNTVSAGANGAQKFYVDGNLVAVSRDAITDNTAKSYYAKFLEYSGKPDMWNTNLSYFCYGKNMDKATFDGRISNATVNGSSAANNSTVTVSSDSATVTFTNQLKRNDGGPATGIYGRWKIDGGGENSKIFSPNSGWISLTTPVVRKTVDLPAGSDEIVFEDMTYSKEVDGDNSVTSWAKVPQTCNLTGGTEGRYCVKLTRNMPQVSGAVDVSVTTDHATNSINPSGAVSSTNGSYTVKFQHTVSRGSDGAGGSVSIRYSTSPSASSNRGSTISEGGGTARSGTKSARERQKVIAVPYSTEVIRGTLFPGESRTFCQDLSYSYTTWHTRYEWTGKKWKKKRYSVNHNGSGHRCATVSRPNNLKCAIDGQSYGIDAGKNTARMKVINRTNNTSSSVTFSGNPSVWAKPTDLIRYEYEVCASGQLHDDYYSWGGGSKSSYVFTGGNTTSSYPNRYLFPSDLGTGLQPYTALFGYSSTSFGGQSPYENDFASPTVNTLGCGLSNPGQYYQIPALHNSSNCRSQEYIGRRSDAGSVISQTLAYTAKPGSGNNTIKGDVKVPYNYYLHVNPQSNNPKNVPVNADNSFNMTYKVSVKPRCNVQVQGSCNATSNEYQTYPKTTKYRIYSWLVNRNYSEAQLKSELGTEIRDHTTNELIGYLTSDPASNRNKFTINKSGDDLFGSEGLSVTISTDGSSKITVPHNAPIGSKICVALAVWPSDSHDVPSGAVINDGSQSVALTNRSNSGLWRSSKPNCYTVGKKPSISIKNGLLYAYNGVTASAFMRKPGGVAQEYLFGSWSEYNALSSRSTIIGLSSGAGLAGGTTNFPADSNARVCRFSSMTLANTDCSTGNVGKVTLSNSATTSPKNMLEQIMTRYTATIDSQGNAIEGLADGSEVDFKGMCKYDERAGTYIPTNTADSGNYHCLNNGASYISSSGTLKFTDDIPGGGRNGITRVWHIQHNDDQYGTRTYVVRAKKIIVNRDIRYGTESYENTNDGHSKTIFQSLAEMPQVLLIADEIVIGESVRNLDAWLIADKIDTCGISYDNKPLSTEEINSKVCNKQLHINGPVFTKNLYLNRTFGSGGDSQIARDTGGDQYLVTLSENGTGNFGTDKNVIAQPAEVFTISPEVYMWAYAEGTRFSQATTTYQRELPTRY